MNIEATIQARIDAQQDYDAIEYGIRACGGTQEWAQAQIKAACQAATRAAGVFITQDWRDQQWELRKAKKIAGERLKAAKAAQAEFGNLRQIRLELAA